MHLLLAELTAYLAGTRAAPLTALEGVSPGIDNIVCECGGLGWLPAGYVRSYRNQGI